MLFLDRRFNQENEVVAKLKKALEGKKIVRLSGTVDQGLEQTILDIPQEIWYQYSSPAEEFLTKRLEERGIRCIRPFNDDDMEYSTGDAVTKLMNNGSIEKMEEEPVFFTFMSSPSLDEVCGKYDFLQLMPSYALFKEVENKTHIHRYGLRDGLGRLPFFSVHLDEISYKEMKSKTGGKFVIQFSSPPQGGHSCGGRDTYIVDNEKDFSIPKQKGYKTRAKISRFVRGEELSMNVVTTSRGVITSDLFPQVMGEPFLCGNPLFYNGSHFEKRASDQVRKKAEEIAVNVGEALYKKNYRGYFGLDFILEDNTDELFVIEINPRFTGSFFMHSFLSAFKDKTPLITFHLAEGLDCLPSSLDVEQCGKELFGLAQGGFCYVLNKEKKTVQLLKAPAPGTYRIKKNSLEYAGPHTPLADFPPRDHFSLNNIWPLNKSLPYARPDLSLCTVLSLEPIFCNDRKLLPKYRNAIQELYNKFEFN